MRFEEAIEPEIYFVRYPYGIYKGEMKEQVPYGFGKMKYKNGDIYIGQFKDGMRNG